jgi:hypothetical protein
MTVTLVRKQKMKDTLYCISKTVSSFCGSGEQPVMEKKAKVVTVVQLLTMKNQLLYFSRALSWNL